MQDAAPGHVATVRHHVIDALTDEQIDRLAAIGDAILATLDSSATMTATSWSARPPTGRGGC